jgi:two-component sensor histidine kinase
LTRTSAKNPASDESHRLETLQEYQLLDTDPELAFDRITKLVADLYDVPITLVSLVDDCRQWFKSAHGLSIRETARDISFCQFVVSDHKALVVPDTHQDERFRDNPLVTGEPFARFYAGVPLRAYNGDILGTLCILDVKPRAALTDKELARLVDFADIIMAEADLRRSVAECETAKTMLDQALDFSSVAIWQLNTRTNEVVWQGAYEAVWGKDSEESLGSRQGAFDRIHADDRAKIWAELDAAIAGTEPFANEFRIHHPELGLRWLAGRSERVKAGGQHILTGVNYDVTEQHNRQEHADLLMRELHHRMRNLFATVGAIISLTRHSARDVDDYADRISNRLDAMNRAQNVLLGANFMTGSIHALLREVEAAFPRIRWSGPDLDLPENSLVAMALLFNELATNAAKHGALTSDRGQVDISWSIEDKATGPREFTLTWIESGGEKISGPPVTSRFGTSLIDRSVRNNLGGTIERRWDEEGLVCTIKLPIRWATG